MREELRTYCNLFQRNRDRIKEAFPHENQSLNIVCANMLAGKGVLAEENSLKEGKKIINKNTGIFSNFRGHVKLPMICTLAASKNAQERFTIVQQNYEKIKKEFKATEYTALIASALIDVWPNGDITPYVKRGKEIYQKMKKEHPFLTSGEDSIMAILLAFSEKGKDELIREMEQSYRYLKEKIKADANATQTLSHILSLVDGNLQEKCEKTVSIFEMFRQNGRKYGKTYELAMLGIAAAMPIPKEIFIDEVLEADVFLSQQKGYGFWGFNKTERLMHAAMLVIGSYKNAKNIQNVTVSSIAGTITMLVAEEVAMCAIITATAIASTT